jgi:hypothetical protein
VLTAAVPEAAVEDATAAEAAVEVQEDLQLLMAKVEEDATLEAALAVELPP